MIILSVYLTSERFFILLEIMFSCKYILFLQVYLKEINEIKAFNIQNMLSEEIEKTEDLLKHLMPVHVIEQLKEGQIVAEEIKNVPVMFADIVGFTSFSSTKTPEEVIRVLNQLFSKFDSLCAQNYCYKVCTIGDCYLAIGYNGEIDKSLRQPGNELINIVNFAFGLIEAIEETNEKSKCNLQMRVGIHIGKIVGGVSGTNIVRYDIYGSNVMIANKMESNGIPGKVNISEQARNALQKCAQGRFAFDYNQKVEVNLTRKNKNFTKEIDSYFIKRIDEC